MFRSTIPESRLRSGPELVPVVDDAALPFLTQLPERGLDLHPDLHRRGVDIDDLGGEAAAFLHLVDREDVRLHHLVLGGRVVDDRVRHHGPLPVEFDPLHLPHALPPAHRAHGPRREVQRPAGPAPRPVQVVPAPAAPTPPPPRSCRTISTACAIPTAPTGCPRAFSPPDVLTEILAFRAVSPSSVAIPPRPFFTNPRSSIALISEIVKVSWSSATFTCSGVREAAWNARFPATTVASIVVRSRRSWSARKSEAWPDPRGRVGVSVDFRAPSVPH